MSGPTVVSDAKFPIGAGGGEHGLITTVLDFPAGAGVADHKHGGNVLVTVLSGEMTLREKGTERIPKAGESWGGGDHVGEIARPEGHRPGRPAIEAYFREAEELA